MCVSIYTYACIHIHTHIHIYTYSVNPGEHLYEKMIGGMFLGELTRLIAADLIEKKQLFAHNHQLGIYSAYLCVCARAAEEQLDLSLSLPLLHKYTLTHKHSRTHTQLRQGTYWRRFARRVGEGPHSQTSASSYTSSHSHHTRHLLSLAPSASSYTCSYSRRAGTRVGRTRCVCVFWLCVCFGDCPLTFGACVAARTSSTPNPCLN